MDLRPRHPAPFPWLAVAAVGLFASTLGGAAGLDDGPSRPRGGEQAPKVKPRPAPAKPASPPDTKPAGPVVVSKTKLKEQARTSGFLRPPGAARSDDYGTDWDEVPPWRQTSFFGVKARGQFFVYVVDCSGSMIEEDRLTRAKAEVRRAAAGLVDPQKFLVIFYNDQPIPMPGGLPRTAGLDARGQLLAWLRLIEPDGETDPRGAMTMALALRPDAIFLLSDGEFPDGTVESVAARNARKTPIHCIDLSREGTGEQLRKIAGDSGGTYVIRPSAVGND